MARLLFITPDRLAPERAGPAIRAIEIARALARQGLAVTLASPHRPEIALEEVDLVHLPLCAIPQAAWHADAVMVQAFMLHEVPTLARVPVPLIVDLYDPLPFEALHLGRDRPLERRLYSHDRILALTLLAAHTADVIVVAHRRQADWVLGILTALGRIRPGLEDGARHLLLVVPNGCPPTPPAPRPDLAPRSPMMSGRPVVVWPGGLWEWTDPSTLVEAAALLAPARPDIAFLLWGTRHPNPDVPPMPVASQALARARALGLLGRTVFAWEWVPYDERGHWLAHASMGVSLHHPTLEARFAHRTRLLDCFWARLPVVVTGGDPLANLVRRRRLGEVVPAHDAAAVARAVVALLSPGRRRGIARRLAALAGQLSWEAAVRPLASRLVSPGGLRSADRADPSSLVPLMRFLALRFPAASLPLRGLARLLNRGHAARRALARGVHSGPGPLP